MLFRSEEEDEDTSGDEDNRTRIRKLTRKRQRLLKTMPLIKLLRRNPLNKFKVLRMLPVKAYLNRYLRDEAEILNAYRFHKSLYELDFIYFVEETSEQ